MSILKHFRPRAVICDKDGTLIDTESIHYETYHELVHTYGGQHDIATHQLLMGKSDFDCLRILQAKHPAFPQHESHLPTLRDMQWKIYAEIQEKRGIQPMPGAEEFLHACRKQGIPLGLVTNARQKDTTDQLTQLHWQSLFSAVVTAEDVSHPKPAPDVYLKAIHLLGMTSGECIALEDTHHGITSASLAGVPAIFVCDQRFELTTPKEAVLTVHSFFQLLA